MMSILHVHLNTNILLICYLLYTLLLFPLHSLTVPDSDASYTTKYYPLTGKWQYLSILFASLYD